MQKVDNPVSGAAEATCIKVPTSVITSTTHTSSLLLSSLLFFCPLLQQSHVYSGAGFEVTLARLCALFINTFRLDNSGHGV